MKRYRILQFDFDSRANLLSLELGEGCDDTQRLANEERKESIRAGLLQEYGTLGAEQKLRNFVELGPKPLSILAFHNAFSQQVRHAFVVGAYYPALTGACALGERILNHLVLLLRKHYKHTAEYKSVARKQSFDNWKTAIQALEAWRVLLPEAAAAFRELESIRNRAIHFDPAVDSDDRQRALEAIAALDAIIASQFAAFFSSHWFIPDIPGAAYIRKELEAEPFVKEVYLPNALLLGPRATVGLNHDHVTVDDPDALSIEAISDDAFRQLVLLHRASLVAGDA